MNLLDNVQTQITEAMRAKDTLRLNTLRSIKTALTRYVTDQQKPVTEAVEINILKQQVKQRNDSIVAFDNGNRPELAANERVELAILQSFLPVSATHEEIDRAITESVNELSENNGTKSMGIVMKSVNAKLIGKMTDGKIISEKVKKALSGNNL